MLKASTSLLKHIKSEAKQKAASSSKKNLLATGDDESEGNSVEPIWLTITTKKHVVDKKRLKPGRIELPHSLNKAAITSVCLITSDPQRSFKEVISHPSFPKPLASQLRVLGVSKIKTRYKSFESKRQLVAEHDVFLADDRAITLLPRLLGKTLYETSKRPIPVNIAGNKPRDEAGKKAKVSKDSKSKTVAAPTAMAKEIEKALSSAQVQLSPSVTTSVRIGFSTFEPEEIADNVAAAVEKLQAKFITKGWRNIRAIHIKGPNTAAVPIWQTSQLWIDDEDVLDEEQAKEAKLLASQKGRKRKGRELDAEAETDDAKSKKIKKSGEDGFSKEMTERREMLRQQKKEARDRAENIEAPKKLEEAKPSVNKKAKTKVMKMATVAATA